ncbi:MAG: acylphosphatase [Verrucomicrobia bacterium CG_4_10_14_3_um_filter_43_23]|nr:MAG: hypothetical protein AUJ82_03660 [Verrucomicrobia bacterium CG1_02_43_26]PIP58919.1 MAG: acylphosphatase [Verrucomicrobia bacterium CG22_combo_CG10-13_8_21_14_all_43_17]PIX57646.1 MAG: acylphosphatase [Verrucomicrobia bacterium CG_4_10_14_3_um_filter_43_23]PIY61781.1 MAG: acylphosphatase [Verrucomicrobia bacterium CG_4_10_14_0_8_um_filter_43_34]PJA44730.1 MAG: acylphosphatase [Verrucomicrobia bacterium CG_4_9_14_3_um_filter_43_20]
MKSTIFHLEAYISGHVQGVGFRYTTYQIAKGFDVTGQVKNLDDGRVWLEVEGDEGEAKAFLDAIKEHMRHYIKDVEVITTGQVKRRSGFIIS